MNTLYAFYLLALASIVGITAPLRAMQGPGYQKIELDCPQIPMGSQDDCRTTATIHARAFQNISAQLAAITTTQEASHLLSAALATAAKPSRAPTPPAGTLLCEESAPKNALEIVNLLTQDPHWAAAHHQANRNEPIVMIIHSQAQPAHWITALLHQQSRTLFIADARKHYPRNYSLTLGISKFFASTPTTKPTTEESSRGHLPTAATPKSDDEKMVDPSCSAKSSALPPVVQPSIITVPCLDQKNGWECGYFATYNIKKLGEAVAAGFSAHQYRDLKLNNAQHAATYATWKQQAFQHVRDQEVAHAPIALVHENGEQLGQTSMLLEGHIGMLREFLPEYCCIVAQTHCTFSRDGFLLSGPSDLYDAIGRHKAQRCPTFLIFHSNTHWSAEVIMPDGTLLHADSSKNYCKEQRMATLEKIRQLFVSEYLAIEPSCLNILRGVIDDAIKRHYTTNPETPLEDFAQRYSAEIYVQKNELLPQLSDEAVFDLMVECKKRFDYDQATAHKIKLKELLKPAINALFILRKRDISHTDLVTELNKLESIRNAKERIPRLTKQEFSDLVRQTRQQIAEDHAKKQATTNGQVIILDDEVEDGKSNQSSKKKRLMPTKKEILGHVAAAVAAGIVEDRAVNPVVRSAVAHVVQQAPTKSKSTCVIL